MKARCLTLTFLCLLGLITAIALRIMPIHHAYAAGPSVPIDGIAKPEFFHPNIATIIDNGRALNIRSQNDQWLRIPTSPYPAHEPLNVPAGPVGVGIDGTLFPSYLDAPSKSRQWRRIVTPTLTATTTAQANKANQSSLLLGFALDGFPIYGPRCYSQAFNAASGTRLMKSSYQLRNTRVAGGPAVNESTPLGTFERDYEYLRESETEHGDLDECNGHFAATINFPQGIYHYHMTVDENGRPTFPYIVGKFYGQVDHRALDRDKKNR